MTQQENKASKYKTKAFIELGLAFVFVLALTALVTLYHTKMTNQLYVHIITYVTGMIFFTLAYIKVFSIDLRKPEYVENRKESRLSFFNYLVETGFKPSVVKILGMLVAFFSFYVLFMLWFGAEEFAFRYHKIKTLLGAFAIAIAFSPDVELPEEKELDTKKEPDSFSASVSEPVVINSNQFARPASPIKHYVDPDSSDLLNTHKISVFNDSEVLTAARKKLAKAINSIDSKNEDGVSLYQTYAPVNEDELIKLLDAGFYNPDSTGSDVVYERDGVEYYRTSGATNNLNQHIAGMKWLLRTKYSKNLENKLLQLKDASSKGQIRKNLLNLKIKEERISSYDKGAYQYLRALVLFTLTPLHCKNFLEYCISHKGEHRLENRVIAFAISVQDKVEQAKYSLAFNEMSLDLDIADETDGQENIFYHEAIKEFSEFGIINYPSPAVIYEIEDDYGINDEYMFSKYFIASKRLFEILLLNSPFIRSYDAAKPNVINAELLYKGIQLCAPDLNIEGAWEEDSETPEATLHWIVDNIYYNCASNEEYLAIFDWQLPMTNYALETMGLKAKVFRGHGDEIEYMWFFNPDILCPLLDKYKISYFIEEWKK